MRTSSSRLFAALFAWAQLVHLQYNSRGIVFIMLQLDSSVHFKMGDDKQQTRSQIKCRFMEEMRSYDTSELIEAHRFLLPAGERDEPVRWHDADPVE